MSKMKAVWETYGQLNINNDRALEIIRMVRDLYPHEITDVQKYDFWEVLGIVQETLECNGKVLIEHEEARVALEDWKEEGMA